MQAAGIKMYGVAYRASNQQMQGRSSITARLTTPKRQRNRQICDGHHSQRLNKLLCMLHVLGGCRLEEAPHEQVRQNYRK
jgi:hypothetical protein